EPRRVLGRRIRRLAFLGETQVGSDYLDLVSPRGLEETGARAFARHLRENAGSWDLIDLTDLSADSPTVKAIEEAFSGGPFEVRITGRFVCPFERFDGAETFDRFLRRTGRRDNYLRRRKWLERQPGFRIS